MISDAKDKSIHGKGLKILTLKLAQVKASNTSENLLIEVRKIMYSFCVKSKSLKSIERYNKFTKVVKQNGYYIYGSS